jgi:hypothetical protein
MRDDNLWSRVFICSPYRGKTTEEQVKNVELAKRFCAYAVAEKRSPIAPHLLYPQFLNDEDVKDRRAGINCGLAFLASCIEIWVLGTYLSEGMLAEIAEASRNKIPIVFFSYNEDTNTFLLRASGSALANC